MTETEQQSSQTKNTKGVIKGRDIQQAITVTFKESALGCTKEISFARNENCDTCEGTGAKPGATQVKCQVCNGAGHIVEQINSVSYVKLECEDC